MYDSIELLLNEILAGEDTFLEFKEVVFKGNQIRFAREEGRAQNVIAEVFVSMANTEGGVIIFGVNKDREVIGIDETKRDILEQFVVNLAVNNCKPPLEPAIDWLLLPDSMGRSLLCLKATIQKSRYYVHQTTDGRFLKRVGSHRSPIPAEQLGRLLAVRNLLIPFEERPVMNSSINDIDPNRFKAYYQRRFGSTPEERGLSTPQLLLNLKLVIKNEDGALLPTNLGMLLFSENPDKWLNGAFIDIAVYDHDVADGNTKDSRKIYGPAPEQIAQAFNYLMASPFFETSSSKDSLGRIDRPVYASAALQEAVVNAIVHRDYELTGSQIRIFIFPDRMEFWNPGGLHNTLRIEDLYAGCQPMRRNQLLAGFLRDYANPVTGRSYMEARGEGFLTLVRDSELISGRRPEIKIQGQAVCLTIFARKIS